MVLDNEGVPKLGLHLRVADGEMTGQRRRPRPPSRSRTRTGGAAGAVVLMVLGTGTLGAFPAVQARGQVRGPVVPVVDAAVTPSPVLDPGIATLFGEVGAMATVTAPATPVPGVAGSPAAGLTGAPAPAPGAPLEQRPAQFTGGLPDQRAQIAIKTAMAQIGLPYVWGGNGPTNGDAGFDCSGLTTFAYAAAGVGLPRTAHTQYYQGPHVSPGAPLQPGDLVFYGTPSFVHHVGMYLGDGKMVNAPTFNQPVQVAFYRWNGDDYLGATRPAATGQTSTGLLPYAPPAPSTANQPFTAPTAPPPTAVPAVTAPQPGESQSAAEAKAQAAATVTVTATPTTSAKAPTTTSRPSSSAVTTTPTKSPTSTTKTSKPTATKTPTSTPKTTSTTTKPSVETTTEAPPKDTGDDEPTP